MKKILLQYYARQNLGDDLFVKILAEQFSDCKINLLTNPLFVPKDLRKNIKVHPYSLLRSVAGKTQSLLGWDHPIAKKIDILLENIFQKQIARNDAFVYIGGSIFMQRTTKQEEITFQTAREPVFTYTSQLQNTGKTFVIGANLGPFGVDGYQEKIQKAFMNYTHVCLRDYSSYCLVENLDHVQYAPDVVFLASQPEVEVKEENVVISVIDISNHTNDDTIINAYYRLLCDTIVELAKRHVPVTLVSFCKREGDERAIKKLICMLPEGTRITTHFYNGNIGKTLEVFSKASFVIASRFHSMILGISFGKPVFPISYNCKTINYLNDLHFAGKYATLSSLFEITSEDVLYNYEKYIVTECTLHKQYAIHQFRALRTFLDNTVKD